MFRAVVLAIALLSACVTESAEPSAEELSELSTIGIEAGVGVSPDGLAVILDRGSLGNRALHIATREHGGSIRRDVPDRGDQRGGG